MELVKELREKAIDTPILIVSAYTKPEILSELFKFERVDFLSKPFTKEELLSKVKELIDEPKESFDRALRMANEFLNSGDLNKAEKLIKKMFSLSPSSPIPHYLMYELLKKRGNLELANKHLNAAKSLDENIEVKKDAENK
nr:response regulator [Thermosipho africanus]